MNTLSSKISTTRLALWIFPISLAVITNLHWDNYFYSHDVPKWLFIDILLSLFVILHRDKVSIRRSHCSLLFFSLLYWSLVTLFWSSHFYTGLSFIIRLALYGVAFNLLVWNYSVDERINLLLSSSLLASGVFLIILAIERKIGVPFSNGAFTPIGFTNNAGHVFNIWIPSLCFCLWKFRNKAWAVLACLALLLGIVYVLYISQIRATTIGLGLSICLFAMLVLISKRQRSSVVQSFYFGHFFL